MTAIENIDNLRSFVTDEGWKLPLFDNHFAKFEFALANCLLKFKNGFSFCYERTNGKNPTIIDYNVTEDFKINIHYDRMSSDMSRVAKSLYDLIHVFQFCHVKFRDFNLLDKVILLSDIKLIELLDKIINIMLPD